MEDSDEEGHSQDDSEPTPAKPASAKASKKKLKDVSAGDEEDELAKYNLDNYDEEEEGWIDFPLEL